MRAMLQAAAAALAAGEPVALALVIASRGSTPRHGGAAMVASPSAQWGTIGGGRLEYEVLVRLRALPEAAAPVEVSYHLGHDVGMCCGGRVTLALVALGPWREVVARALAEPGRLIYEAGRLRFETGPDLGQSPEGLAMPPLDGPAVALRPVVVPVGRLGRVLLAGAGHVSRAVGAVVAPLGYDVVVCDDDETEALSALQALAPAWLAQTVDSFRLADIQQALGGWAATDHLLIMTRDHGIDEQLLAEALRAEWPGYLGLIGSRAKVQRFRHRLEARGVIGAAAAGVDPRWARVHAPIGLAIGAETPEEIAVAIAAELIALRHGIRIPPRREGIGSG